MDTSIEYLKMCEKAVEVQNLWELKVGDFFKPPLFERGIVTELQEGCQRPDAWVWLPRQDQLQEMICGLEVGLQTYCRWLCDYSLEGGAKFTMAGGSMEQLLLGLYMFHKFNKTWTGEDWI